MKNKVNVVSFGLGPIGTRVARYALERESLEVIGGVDIAPDKVGKDLGEVLGLEKKLDVPVASSINEFSTHGGDVAMHCTLSTIKDNMKQLEQLITAGWNIVSSCEELSFPCSHAPREAEVIDKLAKKHNVTVVGAGVNPGYVMDTLAVFLTTSCKDVRKINVLRIVNASERRGPLQRKVGAGKTIAEFEQAAAAQTVRHVGMLESLDYVASALGWKVEKTTESIEPVIADKLIETDYVKVQPGQVAGVHQFSRGYLGGEEVITLELQMYVGAPESVDKVQIEGTPSLENTLRGVHGDIATAAVLVNIIPQVVAAEPGLLTVNNLAVPHVY